MRSAKSTDGGPGSPSAVSPDQEPAEVPVTVNYVGMPPAGSPPHSAKSFKESASPFSFGYRDSIKRYERKSPVSHERHATQNSSETAKLETRPISPPSSVQAKIRQYNQRGGQRPLSPPAAKYPASPPPRQPFGRLPPVSIPRPDAKISDKYKPKLEISGQKSSVSHNGESGRFSPTSSISTESSLSSESSAATIKPSASGGFGQAYVSSLGSSDESLTESSSLLKEEEKITSPAALCIYFDKKGFPDTLV